MRLDMLRNHLVFLAIMLSLAGSPSPAFAWPHSSTENRAISLDYYTQRGPTWQLGPQPYGDMTLLRRNGGEVWAESVPGMGASMFFTLA